MDVKQQIPLNFFLLVTPYERQPVMTLQEFLIIIPISYESGTVIWDRKKRETRTLKWDRRSNFFLW